jgi:GR25 family glycosyltransferase involved in LPS biosynthesis
MNNLITYVIHYTPLKERKYFQLGQLDKLSLKNNVFIEKYDKENLEIEDLIKFDKKILRLGTISLFRKHIYVMELIQKSNFKYNLVLEDDAILDKDFVSKLTRGLKQLPDDYDMLFLGDSCNLHIESSKIKAGQFIYKKCREPTNWGGNGGTRCMDSIIISKKCATKICNYYESIKKNNINLPIDLWLNQVIRNLKLDIYWMEPTIVKQGSVTGKFKCSH